MDVRGQPQQPEEIAGPSFTRTSAFAKLERTNAKFSRFQLALVTVIACPSESCSFPMARLASGNAAVVLTLPQSAGTVHVTARAPMGSAIPMWCLARQWISSKSNRLLARRSPSVPIPEGLRFSSHSDSGNRRESGSWLVRWPRYAPFCAPLWSAGNFTGLPVVYC